VPINVAIQEALFLSILASAVAAIYAALAAFRDKLRLKAPAPEAVVWALTFTYFAAFSSLTLARHYGMATHGLDLGYYANAIYHFGRGHFFGQSVLPNETFINHCAPLLAAFAPFTYIFRDPAYLLLLQTLFIAGGIPLIYIIAKPKAGPRWPAAALAASFALSPPLHGANFYDFHPRSLAVPLVLGAFYFFRRKKFRAGLACTALLAVAQDELALHAVPLALYGGFAAGRRRAGLIAAAVLAAYFGGVCCFLYPRLTYAPPGTPLHVSRYFKNLASHGEGAPLSPQVLATKGGYIGALVLPVVAFLPAGGAALATTATPLAVPALTSTRNVFQIGWQYPLSILPFIYGAAALGLRRLVRPDASQARRFLINAGSVLAVALQVLFIAAFAGRYYRPTVSAAFPTAHEKALAGALTRVPRNIPVCADDVFVAHLAQRPFIYIYYPIEYGDVPAEPEALLVGRRFHPPTELADLTRKAETWGLAPVDVNGDYAYFEKGEGNRNYEHLFRAWYGTIEEWQCWAPGGKRFVADPRAHDGRAKLIKNHLHHPPSRGYIYPPGEYRLVFLLRRADRHALCRPTIAARIISAKDPSSFKVYRRVEEVVASEDYRPYRLRFTSKSPFHLQFDVRTTSPLYFDAVSINSEDFTFEAVRELSPRS
jgi:uncharacterized membrane protein